jgi:glycosyltransferase 2 family protein
MTTPDDHEPVHPPQAAPARTAAGPTMAVAQPSRSTARRALPWVGAAITAALVVVAARALDLGEVWEAIRTSDVTWIAPSVALLAVGVFLRAVRWHSLFVEGTRPPLRAVTSSLLIGYFFNNILPLRAGEAARLVALARKTGASRTQIAATVGLERVHDVAALLLLLAVALPFLPEVTWLRAAAWLGAGLVLALLLAVVFLVRYQERGLRVLLWPLRWVPGMSAERWEHAPANAARGFRGLTDPRMALVALGWTIAGWLALSLSAWVLMFGFDLELSPLAGVLVTIAVGLGMVIPSAPAAAGVFEAATIVALAAYGVAAAPALSYGLVLHAVNFAPYIVAGAVVLAAARRPRAGAERSAR